MFNKQIFHRNQILTLRLQLRLAGLYRPICLLGVCLLPFIGGCNSNPSTDATGGDGIILAYMAFPEADVLKDSRLRESIPSQTQGSFGQVKCGDDNGLAMDYIIMDSSVTFLDSIAAGRRIIACTLWVKLGTMPSADNDSVVLDLWDVPESWNENEVSWTARSSGIPWQNVGGGGTLIDSGLIIAKRISLFAFEWRIGGVLYDTVVLEDGIAVPIPLDSTLAESNHRGTSFGFALRKNSATSSNALISIITNDNLQPTNRPRMVWNYR